MNRTSVSSSNLKDVGYDAPAQILEIGFINGRVYQYFDVPESVYDGLMSADSHGKYFDAEIKKAGYSYRQVR